MVDPTTTNKGYAIPVNGTDVGTWDVPVNGNFSILDKNLGGVLTLSFTNVDVTLSASQAQNAVIILTGTLSADCQLVFPAAVGGVYTIEDQTDNAGFVIKLNNSGTGRYIPVPWGDTFDIYTDGSDCFWRNRQPPGSYLQFPTSTAPRWATIGNPRVPYLLCDGSAYNTTVYARLNRVIGPTFGANVPDLRGRALVAVDAGAGRIGSVIGATLGSAGGSESVTLTTAQIPAHSHGVTDPGHTHGTNAAANTGSNVIQGGTTAGYATATINSATTGISIQSAGSGNSHPNMPPALVGGVVLIKT